MKKLISRRQFLAAAGVAGPDCLRRFFRKHCRFCSRFRCRFCRFRQHHQGGRDGPPDR
mgnify:CR=1 FL=1